jgi:hypothetical protein
MDTKACSLTKEEIKALILSTTYKFSQPDANINDLMERLNYLHKRLKAFEDKDETENKQPAPAATGFSSSASFNS